MKPVNPYSRTNDPIRTAVQAAQCYMIAMSALRPLTKAERLELERGRRKRTKRKRRRS